MRRTIDTKPTTTTTRRKTTSSSSSQQQQHDRRRPSPIDAGEILFGSVAQASAHHTRNLETSPTAARRAETAATYTSLLEQRLVVQAEFFNRRFLVLREEAESELKIAKWVLENRKQTDRKKEELYELEHWQNQNLRSGSSTQQQHQNSSSSAPSPNPNRPSSSSSSSLGGGGGGGGEETYAEKASAILNNHQPSIESMRATLHKETKALRELHEQLTDNFRQKERALDEEKVSWRSEILAIRSRENDLERELQKLSRELTDKRIREVMSKTAEAVSMPASSFAPSHYSNLVSPPSHLQNYNNSSTRATSSVPPFSSYVSFTGSNYTNNNNNSGFQQQAQHQQQQNRHHHSPSQQFPLRSLSALTVAEESPSLNSFSKQQQQEQSSSPPGRHQQQQQQTQQEQQQQEHQQQQRYVGASSPSASPSGFSSSLSPSSPSSSSSSPTKRNSVVFDSVFSPNTIDQL